VDKQYFRLGMNSATLPVDTDDIMWFGKFLQEKGVNLRTQIGQAVMAARDLGIATRAGELLAEHLPENTHVQIGTPTNFDIGLAVAATTLTRVFRQATLRDPKLFEQAWQVMASGAPLAIPQDRTNDRDHMWEILNAAVYSQFASDVQLNHFGAGVDLKGTFCRSQWGIECKVLYAAKAERRIDRIIEGVKQLECDPSVSKGVVAVNVTDCIDHTRFRHSLGGDRSIFPSTKDALKVLADAVKKIAFETSTNSLLRRVTADKHGNKRDKCRAIIYVAQSVAYAGGAVKIFNSQFPDVVQSNANDKKFVEQYKLGWSHL
jgi:hypothetical protein